MKSNAALHAPKPPRTGKRGRPAKKGQRLGKLAAIAATADCGQIEVCRLGRRQQMHVHAFQALFYDVWGERPVQIVLARRATRTEGYDIALVSMDMHATAAEIIEDYDERWSIEVCIEDAKQITGVGEARNRVKHAVERTVPFGLICQSLAICCTRSTAVPSRTSRTAADTPAGTATSATPPTKTCSHGCAARRLPPNTCRLPPAPLTHEKSAAPHQHSTPPLDNPET